MENDERQEESDEDYEDSDYEESVDESKEEEQVEEERESLENQIERYKMTIKKALKAKKFEDEANAMNDLGNKYLPKLVVKFMTGGNTLENLIPLSTTNNLQSIYSA